MYPELQSAFLAEASAPLILLGAAVLLYRSFRQKYLLPWIAGWAVYSMAKLFLAISLSHREVTWLALGNAGFVLAVGLFSAAIFYYIYPPRFPFYLQGLIVVVLLLGVLQGAWFAHTGVPGLIFAIAWRAITWTTALRLILFAQGRGNTGAWLLGAALVLLCQYHPTLSYGILVDVLLGISMMMIVLDDSRLQTRRLDTVNRISSVISGTDDFLPIVNATLTELIQITGAKAGWFRFLEDEKLRLAVQRGLPDEVANEISEIDLARSISGQLLAQSEVGTIKLAEMIPSTQPALKACGIEHIVVVPVIGKSSRIGVLSLGMSWNRTYTEEDKQFLKAAASQLGLAAENRRLVQQLVRSVHDLTEIKAAEEHYKTLFDHMQEGVFISSPEGRILDCNEAFVSMLGYSTKEELLQMQDVARCLYVDISDRCKFVTEMEEHGFVKNFEFSLQRKDGRQISVIESSFAAPDPSGPGRLYQGVVLDITEKKQAEDEIRRRNRELSALNAIAVTFNQSFDLDEILEATLLKIVELFGTDTAAVYLFDEQTNTLRKRSSYGHRSTWLQDNTEFVMPAELVESIKADHTEIIKDQGAIVTAPFPGKFIEAEGLKALLWMILWRKDQILGVLGTSSRSAREFGPADDNVMVAVGRQLATTIDKIQLYEETRKAYEDLRRTQEQLLQSEKMSAVGRLISGVAHEMNNPLTAISGYTQLLESEQLEPRIREFLQKLHKQTDRAQRIVQNLLSFSRQHRPQRIHVDLRRVMEDTIALRDYELKTNNIVLEKNFDSTLPFVVADPHQLEQVFLNIINNAVDAILDHGRGGRLRISIAADAGYVVCEFHDSGPGMVDPKHVFDPFYTTKGVGKGTGLGLSICYGIVKEHGGEISALNHSRGGALVRVRLPIAVGEKPMTERERILARRESSVQGRVLLVDDESALNFEREVLATAGFDVVALDSGEKALELLKQQNFDIVLLDSKTSGPVSSDELMRWMRETRPEIAARTVLMLTNGVDSGSRSFINATQQLCFVKPFEAAELLGVLRRVLRSAATRAAGN